MISVVINTLNEEKNLPKAIASVKDFADEIVVCDMYSDDETVSIARRAGAKVYEHKGMGYVEPARNFAIEKAKSSCFAIYDIYKKAHGMASVPYGGGGKFAKPPRSKTEKFFALNSCAWRTGLPAGGKI